MSLHEQFAGLAVICGAASVVMAINVVKHHFRRAEPQPPLILAHLVERRRNCREWRRRIDRTD